MNWKPGDKAIIADKFTVGDPADLKFRGQGCELVWYVGTHSTADGIVCDCWEVRTENNICWVNEKVLRKPYDASKLAEWSELAEWDDRIFLPKELVVVHE